MKDSLNQLLFGGYPYAVIAVFIVGHIWRYKRDQYSWTTRSSQLFERRWLKIGTLLFHFGLIAVAAGHFGGLLVPKALTEAVGVSDHMYHNIALLMGTLAGVVLTAGITILLLRRRLNTRVRMTTTGRDYLAFLALVLAIGTGMYATVVTNMLGGGYDYRETISPWIRGIFTLQPDPSLMIDVPASFKVHVTATLTLFLLWPFTRLVHAWSLPLAYLRRPYIVYRSKWRV